MNMNFETLVNRRQRILRKKIYPALEFVVLADCTLGEVIRRLDYDRFHIIYILNENLDIMGKITEQELIKIVRTNSFDDKIGDVFKHLL